MYEGCVVPYKNVLPQPPRSVLRLITVVCNTNISNATNTTTNNNNNDNINL